MFDTAQGLSDSHDQIVLAVVGLATLMATALVYVVRTHRTVDEVNAAVNDVGPGEHRLYDKVAHNSETLERIEHRLAQHDGWWDDFHNRWGRLPADLDDSTDLVVALRDIRALAEANHEQILGVGRALADHVEWEMTEKYGPQWRSMMGRNPNTG